MKKFTQDHAKLLYCRFQAIYGDKFIKADHNDKFKSVWYEEWISGLEGIDVGLIKGALDHCRKNLTWVPSIAEFRQICEKASGIPTMPEALAKAIRREFDHPIIAIAYEKVGSWAMKNDKAQELRVKLQSAYEEALNAFRSNPEECAGRLEHVKAQQALPPPPSKIPTQGEIISWRERLKRYQEMAKAEKAKLPETAHPVWPADKIQPRGKNFDQNVYNERKKYLIALDETTAGTLPKEDWYDRTRYLREREAEERSKYSTHTSGTPKEKESPRAYNGPTRVYKDWMN